MARAFDDEINQLLRRLARDVKQEKCDDKSFKLAELIGVSPGFISDFLNEKKGAGLNILTGLGRLAPLEFLGMLGIDPGVVVTLLEGRNDLAGAELMKLPDVIRRAARAAIELYGFTPAEACDAALLAFEEIGALPNSSPSYWCEQIKDRVPKRTQSGERPSSRLRSAEKFRG